MRWLLAAALAACLSAIAGASQAAEKAVLSASCSGLPWPSGAAAKPAELEAWRGSALDVRTMFSGKASWAEIVKSAKYVRNHVGGCAVAVVSVSTLPATHRGQHAACAAGAFDAHIRQFGAGLVANGGASALLRLGYEFNGGSFPWAIGTSKPADWVGCYKRWVEVLRTVPGQAFTYIWNPNARGQFSNKQSIDLLWPGGDYVDIVGVDYYDRCPAVRSQAEWDWRVNRFWPKGGSPDGIGAWLQYAKAKGKKLAVPEWGIGGPQNCAGAGYDNELLIRNMHAFFQANAADIAYEAYFNGREGVNGYRLAPPDTHPRAAAAYRELW